VHALDDLTFFCLHPTTTTTIRTVEEIIVSDTIFVNTTLFDPADLTVDSNLFIHELFRITLLGALFSSAGPARTVYKKVFLADSLLLQERETRLDSTRLVSLADPGT
jgi:hypothetical protein